MDIKELQHASEKQLQAMLNEKRNEMRELRFKSYEGQLKKVRTIRVLKKTIARIMTALNNKKSATNAGLGKSEERK